MKQWANLGAFVHAVHTGDFALLSRSLKTPSPNRAVRRCAGLAAIKRVAKDAGAPGSSLSGSGPSLFALCRGDETASRVAAAMNAAIQQHIGGESQTYIRTHQRSGCARHGDMRYVTTRVAVERSGA